jgi:hypothetical protein
MERLQAAQSRLRSLRTESEEMITRGARTIGTVGIAAGLAKLEKEGVTVDVAGFTLPDMIGAAGGVGQFLVDDPTAQLVLEVSGNTALAVTTYKRVMDA